MVGFRIHDQTKGLRKDFFDGPLMQHVLTCQPQPGP
jgi:hypothetical protein